jgi:hypothetical protein
MHLHGEILARIEDLYEERESAVLGERRAAKDPSADLCITKELMERASCMLSMRHARTAVGNVRGKIREEPQLAAPRARMLDWLKDQRREVHRLRLPFR